MLNVAGINSYSYSPWKLKNNLEYEDWTQTFKISRNKNIKAVMNLAGVLEGKDLYFHNSDFHNTYKKRTPLKFELSQLGMCYIPL